MSDIKALADRLLAFEGSDALGNGDFSLLREAAAALSPQADKARGEVVAIRNELEALAERWYASVQGKPGSRRIATIDESNPALAMRGEDDFDNEAFAYRRCAQEVEKIARRLSATPQPQGDASPNADRMAIRMLVDAGFVTEAKANEALNIAHGFDKGPLTPQARPDGGEVRCVVCSEDEAHTGACGSSDPRALCNTHLSPAPDVEKLDWIIRQLDAPELAAHGRYRGIEAIKQVAIRFRAQLIAAKQEGGE